MGNSRYVSQISISEIRNSRLISRYDLIISISKWKHRICHHGNSRASAVVIRSPTLPYYYTVNNTTLAGYEPKSLKWTWEETRLKSKLISKLIGHFSCYLRKRNHNKNQIIHDNGPRIRSERSSASESAQCSHSSNGRRHSKPLNYPRSICSNNAVGSTEVTILQWSSKTNT